MTKRERVIAAIEGKKVDAIPSSFSSYVVLVTIYQNAASVL